MRPRKNLASMYILLAIFAIIAHSLYMYYRWRNSVGPLIYADPVMVWLLLGAILVLRLRGR